MFSRLVLVLVMAVSAPAFAKDVNIAPAETKGISFSFPNGGGGTVGLGKFTAPNRQIRLDVGLDINKTDPAPTAFGFSIEAAYRMYCARANALAIYGAPTFFIARAAASGAPVSVGPGYALGAEYFFTQQLALGVSTGVNFLFSDSFNSFRLNTGTTAITGTFYWQ